jgi:hypothetical protein
LRNLLQQTAALVVVVETETLLSLVVLVDLDL